MLIIKLDYVFIDVLIILGHLEHLEIMKQIHVFIDVLLIVMEIGKLI